MKFLFDANAVVTHKKDRLVIFQLVVDLDLGIFLFPHKFDGVINEVLHDFDDSLLVHAYGWEIASHFDRDLPLFQLTFHTPQRLGHNREEWHDLSFIRHPSDP